MTPQEFSALYPKFERRNQATIKRQHDTMVKVNENLDKEAWKAKRWTEEHRTEQSQKFSKEVKQYWLDPSLREQMIANNKKNLENHWKNPQFISNHKLRMSKQLSDMWKSSEFRKSYASAYANNESWKQKRHDNMIRRWQEAEYRESQIERLTNAPANPSRKSYKLFNGESVVLRSGWEFALYQKLLENKITFQYESLRIPYEIQNEKHTYIPDFYLPEQNLIIEVKPKHQWEDEIVQAKLQASKSQGYQIKLLDIEGINSLDVALLSNCSSTTIERIGQG